MGGDVGEARKRWAARQQRTLPEPKEKPFSSGALTVGAAVVEVATSAQRMAARDMGIEGFGVVSVQGQGCGRRGSRGTVFSSCFFLPNREGRVRTFACAVPVNDSLILQSEGRVRRSIRNHPWWRLGSCRSFCCSRPARRFSFRRGVFPSFRHALLS